MISVATRWAEWARRLATARARIERGWPRPAMTLVALPALRRLGVMRCPFVRRTEHHFELAVRIVRLDPLPGRRPAPAAASRRTGRLSPPGAPAAAGTTPGPSAISPLVLRKVATRGPDRSDGGAPARPGHAPLEATGASARRIVELRRRVEELSPRRAASVGGPLPARGAEGGAGEAPGPTGVDPQTGWALPVGGRPPLLVRHSAGESRTAPDTPSLVAVPPAANGSAPAADAFAPRLDLERLADQVVRHIDRRIVAHRERVGRI